MSEVHLPTATEWGYASKEAASDDIIQEVVLQTNQAIQNFCALPEGPEYCNDRTGYSRVSVTIPLTAELLDQLMNGATGYRAHYFVSIAAGEQFNRRLVDAVAPLIVKAASFYKDKFEPIFCRRSLLGSFSKFWFPKSFTDPSAQDELLKLEEKLKVSRWVKYWKSRAIPRKGLLAPVPESPSVLLNGTFVDDAGKPYEQNPNRSKQIFDTGWT